MKNLDLGLIGNSRTSALIDRQARIVWWCYPHFDSNPLCCSLLRPEPIDAAPEAFGFTDVLFPDSHTVRQVYQRNSAILQTRNQAWHQVQNDVFGAAILASTHAFFDSRLERPAGRQMFADLERLGQQAIRVYQQVDAGIWELRGSQRIHTFSSLMCWAACDRLAAIATRLNLKQRAL